MKKELSKVKPGDRPELGGPSERYRNAQHSMATHKIGLDNNMEEGMRDMAKKVGGMAKKVGGAVLNKLGHGDDADMMRDLQRKMGVPQTGMKPGAEPNPKQVKEKMSPTKAKSFAALAEPKDKITFADKIAGAKKEVDEMLGDVAAEAMKGALRGGQKKLKRLPLAFVTHVAMIPKLVKLTLVMILQHQEKNAVVVVPRKLADHHKNV